VFRIVAGLLKGGIVGAGLGYGALRLGLGAGATAWVIYAGVGVVVGLVCGRPLWRHDTLWTPLLKAVVGAGIALGLAWLGRRFLGDVSLAFGVELGLPSAPLRDAPWALGALVGALYGIFVEVDDGGDAGPTAKSKA
jgi:hypothetical protein